MMEIKYALLYYAVMSGVLFILMGVDKLKAVAHKWRVPERVLFAFGLLGGFFGGFVAMALFRHKIRKPLFYLFFSLGMIIHIILIFYTKEFFYVKGI